MGQTLNQEQTAHNSTYTQLGSILSVANGWGEESTFYKVGGYYETVKIAKIQQETMALMSRLDITRNGQ